MNKKLGKIVKKAREKRGWSQNRLAEETKRNFPPRGVSQSTIHRIENPNYQANPTEGTKEKLFLTLGIIDDKQTISNDIKIVDQDLRKKIELLDEQVDFYKEKAGFYEQKTTDLQHSILSGRRAGDPENIDVMTMRKIFNGSRFPYGFKTE